MRSIVGCKASCGKVAQNAGLVCLSKYCSPVLPNLSSAELLPQWRYQSCWVSPLAVSFCHDVQRCHLGLWAENNPRWAECCPVSATLGQPAVLPSPDDILVPDSPATALTSLAREIQPQLGREIPSEGYPKSIPFSSLGHFFPPLTNSWNYTRQPPPPHLYYTIGLREKPICPGSSDTQ
jgi:hypothetical protein